MNKLLFLSVFIFCAVISFAQTPYSVVKQGNPNQLYQWQGAIQGARGFILPVNDTLNNPATPFLGALTVLPSDAGLSQIPVWISNGNYWVKFVGGSATNINDTIYTRIPIAVDTTSLPGHQIIYFLKERGLISGGVVTLDSCMTLGLNPTVVNIGYKQYSIPVQSGLVVPPADPSNGRIDRIVIDTNLNFIDIPGMPSPTPTAAPYDIFSQFELTQITVPAGATCLMIGQEIIYDENKTTEWVVTTNGNITIDTANTAAPYHLRKAIYVSQYHNGSSIIFTKGSTDTVTAGEIIKMFPYFNGAFPNQMSGQWYHGSTAVSNSILLNQFFNPNDSNRYLNLSAQLSSWIFSSPIFDKFIITFGGSDTTLTKGLYLDYIQLQKGISNIVTGDFVDSVKTSGDSLFYYKQGLAIYGGAVGGGSGGGINIYNTDSLLKDNRTVGLNSNSLSLTDAGTGTNFVIRPSDGAMEFTSPLGKQLRVSDDANELQLFYDTNSHLEMMSGKSTLTGSLFLNTVSSGASTDSILTINSSTGQVNMINAASFGSSILANNGLTKVVDSVQLGGTLTQNTTISGNSFTLSLLGNVSSPDPQLKVSNTGSGEGINVNGSSGTAIEAVSNSGYGAIITSNSGQGLLLGSTTGLPFQIQANPASTNSIFSMIDMQRYSQGTAASGIGQSIDYEIETTTGIGTSTSLISKWTTATDATRTSEFSITGVNSASSSTLFTLSGSGQLQLNNYGSGTFTGTPTKSLQVTSTGAIIEGSIGGGGTVTNIATGYGLSGGPITTTGTIIADSTLLLTKLRATSLYQPIGTYVTSVSGTSNRITSTGGTTPVIDISASYVGQSSITTLGTVTTGTLSTGAVIGGVTMTLGSDAQGDIYYRNGSGILTRLATGTAKQNLHPDGSGGYSWKDSTAASTGTVTSVATGLGLSGGTITTTGTLLVDTSSASILSRQRAANTYWGLAGNTGVNLPDTSTRWLGTTNNTPLRFKTNGTGRMIIDSIGRVGIGTKTPTQVLDVTGIINASSYVISAFGIYGNAALGEGLNIDAAGHNLSFITNSTQWIRVDGSGRMGVGALSPTALINIKAGTATANTAPLQFTAGIVETTPRSGLVETNSTNDLFYTNSGAVRAQVGMWSYIAKTASYTATNSDFTVDFTSNTDTLTLPTATGITGRVYIVINSTAASICVVQSTGSQVIGNGGILTSQNIPVGSSMTLQSTGTAWRIE